MYTVGDARRIRTWSNVPYFFTRTLEQQGCVVRRVDIGPLRMLQLPYDLVVRTMRALFGTGSVHDYFRSPINHHLTNRTVARTMRRYPDDIHVLLTYSFGSNPAKRPFILFSDITLERHVHYFKERAADRLERINVRHEARNLAEARAIISLFPELAEELRRTHGDKVRYYGNVVNLDASSTGTDALLGRKWRDKQLLFIGKGHYKQGLLLLLRALDILNAGRPAPVPLDVIGLKRSDVHGPVPPGVRFHGYLDKGRPEQYRRYLDLLERAFLFVNPNPKWAAFSASCEAMHFHTPVVIHPYAEFVRTFGEEESLGCFLRSDDPAELAARLGTLLADREGWTRRAINAHRAVEPFTWDSFVRRFLSDVDRLYGVAERTAAVAR